MKLRTHTVGTHVGALRSYRIVIRDDLYAKEGLINVPDTQRRAYAPRRGLYTKEGLIPRRDLYTRLIHKGGAYTQGQPSIYSDVIQVPE